MMLRPKDDRDLPAKKKAFETNILNVFLERASVSNFMALQIKIISHHLWITLENCSRWHPHTPWKFLSFSPPHPLGISIDHPWGGMDIFWNHTL